MPQHTEHDKPSTFASRQADREARLAAGEVEPPRRAFTIRIDAEESPNVTVTHVRQ